ILTDGISEMEAQRELKKLASKNDISFANFLGGGSYNRFIPAAIATIASRFEFITAYTPYQPEISQGTLQMIYEFQSMICSLTGMDVANASVYDGATACAEAVLMAVRTKRKNKILVSEAINPEYKSVIETYCYGVDVQVDYLPLVDFKTQLNAISNDYACVLLAMPNYYGTIEDIEKCGELVRQAGAMFIVCSDILSLSKIKPPSEFGADVVVGDFQPLGIPMAYGGPYGGFMATKTAHMRQMPGRIVGASIDKEGKRAFTLTMQAREQHIKRERATSNICTNQGLITLCATVYMSLMGQNGMSKAFLMSVQYAKKLASKLCQIKGFEVCNSYFMFEFVIKTPVNSDIFLTKMKEKAILAGLKVDEDKILVCATEMTTEAQIESYIKSAEEITCE
ncbi:MAG: aminomethyl-transferring glycine dehydrogenase subunit GcvPA, partial [bacterium]